MRWKSTDLLPFLKKIIKSGWEWQGGWVCGRTEWSGGNQGVAKMKKILIKKEMSFWDQLTCLPTHKQRDRARAMSRKVTGVMGSSEKKGVMTEINAMDQGGAWDKATNEIQSIKKMKRIGKKGKETIVKGGNGRKKWHVVSSGRDKERERKGKDVSITDVSGKCGKSPTSHSNSAQ